MEVQDVLSVALARAVTEAVPPEMQNEIFSRALYNHLFAESKDGRTPLKDAFSRALNECAQKLAEKMFEEPEIRAKLETSLREAFEENMKTGELVKKLAGKMAGGLRW